MRRHVREIIRRLDTNDVRTRDLWRLDIHRHKNEPISSLEWQAEFLKAGREPLQSIHFTPPE